ncbi:MAG: methyltransferase [Bacteroidales bacterium]|nr:methyltransferase [Bacteroidales bacterium]MBN2755635.1 methyltransferase [Bacteroidales bacterium]
MQENESGLIFTVSGKKIQVNRPQPIISDIDVVSYKRRMDPQIAVEALVEGHNVLIADFYSSGLAVLNELKKYVKNKNSDQSFQGQRDFRSVFRELSHRILLFVSHNKLTVRKAPVIGWFSVLYPELDEFLLPFPQVQGLNSSWQWYEKGISIPVLNKKIHPFFGTYFPTRFEHLTLFDNWLKKYNGEKKSAIDIGIGSGVLSFQMLKYGFEKIYGTDSNPNAIFGLHEDLNNTKLNSKIELMHGNLFADFDFKTELIVFNPPWLPAYHNMEGLDKAIYYDSNLFPQFFAEAKKHLKEDGRVVLMFSNLAQITKVSEFNPIEAELLKGGRFQKEIFIQKKVSEASKKTRRNQNWRNSEMVELWVLKMRNA